MAERIQLSFQSEQFVGTLRIPPNWQYFPPVLFDVVSVKRARERSFLFPSMSFNNKPFKYLSYRCVDEAG